MKMHLFLIAISFSSYAFIGWYAFRAAPKAELNRQFAVLGVFVSSWTLLIFLFASSREEAFADAWYANELFSYLPKSLLVLHYILHLTGFRKRFPSAILVFLYLIMAIDVLFGLCYYVSLPIGEQVYGLLRQIQSPPSLLRIIYAFISLSQYATGFILLGLWHRSTVLHREKNMALYHIVLGVFVVSVNSLLGLIEGTLHVFEIDLLIVLQLMQPFALVFAIVHYKVLKTTDTIISEHIRSQLSFAVSIVDRRGEIVSANAATEELVGLSEADLLGRSYKDLLSGPGHDIPPLDESKVGFYECDFKSLDSSIPMSLSVTPIRDRWDDCLGYVLIGQPIKRLVELQGGYALSSREKEVCFLLMQGLSNQEIATRLFISPGTVKNHLYNIYEKTGVRNRVELSRLFS